MFEAASCGRSSPHLELPKYIRARSFGSAPYLKATYKLTSTPKVSSKCKCKCKCRSQLPHFHLRRSMLFASTTGEPLTSHSHSRWTCNLLSKSQAHKLSSSHAYRLAPDQLSPPYVLLLQIPTSLFLPRNTPSCLCLTLPTSRKSTP